MIFIHYIEICHLHRQDIHHLAGERSEAGVQAESGRVGGEEGVGGAQQQGEDGEGWLGEDGGELLDDGGDQQTPTE